MRELLQTLRSIYNIACEYGYKDEVPELKKVIEALERHLDEQI